MSDFPFRFPDPVTLVGGGPVDTNVLSACINLAPALMAADGGGNTVLPHGREFHSVIGDMDSVVDVKGLEARGVRMHHVAEQDSTDLEKCVTRIHAPLILGVGFTGGRVDHQLGALNVLSKFPDRAIALVGRQDVCFVCHGNLRFELVEKTRVSLFPMAPARAVKGRGLKWSPEGIDFAPAGLTGTSNEALGGPVELAFEGGPVLVILPQDELRQVFDVLTERQV